MAPTSDEIVWLATSAAMNPLLPPQVVDKAMRSDPERAQAEYLSIWRSDSSDFLPGDVILDATDWGVRERAPLPGVRYWAYTDAAGGTGQDAFALAIAHNENGTVVIDAVRLYQPRFVPSNVIADLAALLRSYGNGISKVFGDKWAAGFVADEWRRNGIICAASDKSTSENYLAALPLLLSGRARLVDHKVLREQFASLERRVSSAGRESVSHPDTHAAHDDLACATAGALVLAARPRMPMRVYGMHPTLGAQLRQVGNQIIPHGSHGTSRSHTDGDGNVILRSDNSAWPTTTRKFNQDLRSNKPHAEPTN